MINKIDLERRGIVSGNIHLGIPFIKRFLNRHHAVPSVGLELTLLFDEQMRDSVIAFQKFKRVEASGNLDKIILALIGTEFNQLELEMMPADETLENLIFGNSLSDNELNRFNVNQNQSLGKNFPCPLS